MKKLKCLGHMKKEGLENLTFTGHKTIESVNKLLWMECWTGTRERVKNQKLEQQKVLESHDHPCCEKRSSIGGSWDWNNF